MLCGPTLRSCFFSLVYTYLISLFRSLCLVFLILVQLLQLLCVVLSRPEIANMIFRLILALLPLRAAAYHVPRSADNSNPQTFEAGQLDANAVNNLIVL